MPREAESAQAGADQDSSEEGRMATLEGEIQERVAALPPAKQRQVLEYIRSLGKGPSGEEWLRDIPRISEEFANDLRAALAESRRMDSRGG
jgi:hypothetical protein